MSTHIEETVNNFPRDMQWGTCALASRRVAVKCNEHNLRMPTGQGVQLLEDFTKLNSDIPTCVRQLCNAVTILLIHVSCLGAQTTSSNKRGARATCRQ